MRVRELLAETLAEDDPTPRFVGLLVLVTVAVLVTLGVVSYLAVFVLA